MKKLFRLTVYVLLVSLLLPLSAAAAPFLETEPVNLPGWLGGLLTVLALLLPIFFRLWLNQQK